MRQTETMRVGKIFCALKNRNQNIKVTTIGKAFTRVEEGNYGRDKLETQQWAGRAMFEVDKGKSLWREGYVGQEPKSPSKNSNKYIFTSSPIHSFLVSQVPINNQGSLISALDLFSGLKTQLPWLIVISLGAPIVLVIFFHSPVFIKAENKEFN